MIRHILLTAQDKHRGSYEKQGVGRLLDLGGTYDQVRLLDDLEGDALPGV